MQSMLTAMRVAADNAGIRSHAFMASSCEFSNHEAPINSSLPAGEEKREMYRTMVLDLFGAAIKA
jgi:hypothetical protein